MATILDAETNLDHPIEAAEYRRLIDVHNAGTRLGRRLLNIGYQICLAEAL